MAKEVEFLDIDLETEANRNIVRAKYAEGWHLVWVEKNLKSDGVVDFCMHMAIMEREKK